MKTKKEETAKAVADKVLDDDIGAAYEYCTDAEMKVYRLAKALVANKRSKVPIAVWDTLIEACSVLDDERLTFEDLCEQRHGTPEETEKDKLGKKETTNG